MKSNFFNTISILLLAMASCSNLNHKDSQKSVRAVDNAKAITQVPKDTAINFRATGTEPFWGLEISEKQIVLNLIEDSVITATPIPTTLDAKVKTYHISENGILLNIKISEIACTNGMSGKVSPYTVDISFKKDVKENLRKLSGCGDYLSGKQGD